MPEELTAAELDELLAAESRISKSVNFAVILRSNLRRLVAMARLGMSAKPVYDERFDLCTMESDCDRCKYGAQLGGAHRGVPIRGEIL